MGRRSTVSNPYRSLSDPTYGLTTFEYDALSRVTKVIPPDGSATANNITTSYSYDALHRLTGRNYSDTTPAVDYFYDQTSYNGLTITNGIGRRTGMSDAAGQQAWSYDVMGRVVADRRTTNGVTLQFGFAYNLAGSLATLTYPSGNVVAYSYNAAGRALSAVDSANGINYATQAQYAPHGALASINHGEAGPFALVGTYSFNNRLQPSRLRIERNDALGCQDDPATPGPGCVLDLVYDFGLGTANNGNVLGITNRRDNNRSQTFTYDQLNRLATAETPTAWGLNFTHDPWGNLLQQTVTKGSAPMLDVTVNNQNQITNPGFTYDPAGNLTNDGSLPYTYDAENLLTSADGFTYSYDGGGRRVQKSTGVLYWYSVSGQVWVESDSAGNPLREYIFFSTRRIARRDSNGSVFYFFDDHLGSVRVVTNSTGGVVEDSDYYPFGAERTFVDTLDNPYKFIGHERDTESGLDYYQFRMLSSSLARWSSPDPLCASNSLPEELNKYSYVANDPVNRVDPLGLSSFIGILTGQDDVSLCPASEQYCTYAGQGGIIGSSGRLYLSTTEAYLLRKVSPQPGPLPPDRIFKGDPPKPDPYPCTTIRCRLCLAGCDVGWTLGASSLLIAGACGYCGLLGPTSAGVACVAICSGAAVGISAYIAHTKVCKPLCSKLYEN